MLGLRLSSNRSLISSFVIVASMLITIPATHASDQIGAFNSLAVSVGTREPTSELFYQKRLQFADLRCPEGTSPIYSVILVHGSGDGMLCALARSEATKEFEERRQRAKEECEGGGPTNRFQEASRQESTACECSSLTPNCTIALTQEFFCCGPIQMK